MSQLRKPKKDHQFVKSLFGKYDEIPEDWKIKKFDELFEFLRTGTNPRSDLEKSGDIQYIHYGDIHSKWNSILDCDSEEIPWIKKTKVEKLPFLKDGDLIIADASEDYEGSGASILLKNVKNKKIVSGLHTIALRSIDENISSDFKTYLTSIKFVKNQIIGFVTGISVYGLSKNNLKKIRIPLPTLREQQKIASILANVDSLINQTQKVIDQTISYKKALMQKFLINGNNHTEFKNEEWYFGKKIQIPLNWDIKPLSQISKLTAGGTPRTSKKEYWENGTIPWLTSGEINFNRITSTGQKITKLGLENSAAKLFPKHSVLIAITGFGMTRGRSSYLEIESSTNQSVVGVIPKKDIINSEYLWYYLRKQYWLLRSFAQGTQQPGLNLDILNDFLTIFPKNVKEGEKIASLFSNIDKKIESEQEYKKTAQSYKLALMQKLFTGQKRVKI